MGLYLTPAMDRTARKANVSPVERHDGGCNIQCNECLAVWSPCIKHGGGFSRGWHKCPNGCNDPKRK